VLPEPYVSKQPCKSGIASIAATTISFIPGKTLAYTSPMKLIILFEAKQLRPFFLNVP
jgi:hypothetical protein